MIFDIGLVIDARLRSDIALLDEIEFTANCYPERLEALRGLKTGGPRLPTEVMVGDGLLTVRVWTVGGRFLRKLVFQVQFSDNFQNSMFSFFEVTLRKRKVCISLQIMLIFQAKSERSRLRRLSIKLGRFFF